MTTTTSTREKPRSQTLRERISGRWLAVKPRVFAFAIGVIAGPLISSYLGLQVTTFTANEQVRLGVLEQQALFCESQARADVKDTTKLDWNGRRELATKWAVMPGMTAADFGVVGACAQKLSA